MIVKERTIKLDIEIRHIGYDGRNILICDKNYDTYKCVDDKISQIEDKYVILRGNDFLSFCETNIIDSDGCMIFGMMIPSIVDKYSLVENRCYYIWDMIYIGCEDCVYIFDLKKELVKKIKLYSTEIYQISKMNDILIIFCENNKIIIWDMKNEKQLYNNIHKNIRSATYLNDKLYLYNDINRELELCNIDLNPILPIKYKFDDIIFNI